MMRLENLKVEFFDTDYAKGFGIFDHEGRVLGEILVGNFNGGSTAPASVSIKKFSKDMLVIEIEDASIE